MWGFLGGKFGGDKWGFLIDRVGIFSQDLPATLISSCLECLEEKENLKIEIILC